MKIRGALKNGMVVGSLLMVLFLAPAAYGQDFVFRGVKLGCSLKEQDKSLTFRKGASFDYDVDGLKDLGPGYMSSGHVDLIDGKVERFLMMFATANADEFSAMITEKYGKPKSITKNSMQTYGGAVLGAHIIYWQVKDVSVIMRSCSASDIRFGTLTVSTKKMNEHKAAEEKKAKKKAIGNL